MCMFYRCDVELSGCYDIEAESEEEALDKAYEYLTQRDFNYQKVTEITKEEYYNEFKKVIGGMFDAFYKYEEGDCEIKLDQEKMRQYYEDTKVMKD